MDDDSMGSFARTKKELFVSYESIVTVRCFTIKVHPSNRFCEGCQRFGIVLFQDTLFTNTLTYFFKKRTWERV